METSLFVWFGGILGGNVGAFTSNSSLLNKNDGFTTESHLYFCVNYTFLQPKTICTTSRPNVIYQLAHYMKISHNFDNHHYPYNSKQSSSSVSWPFSSLQSVCWCLRTLKGSLHSLFCFTFFVIYDGADEDDAYIQSRRGGGVWFSTSQSENLNCLRQNIFQVLKNTISWSSSCSF